VALAADISRSLGTLLRNWTDRSAGPIPVAAMRQSAALLRRLAGGL